jgi:amino acid transporter
VNVAAAMYMIGAATRIFGLDPKMQIPLFGSIDNWHFQIFVMILIMIPQVLINIYGIKLAARLNDFSVLWHVGGVLLMAALLTFFGKHHNPLSFLFSSQMTVSPLEASSAEIGGKVIPALVIGDFKIPSPLFALIPGLVDLYRAAPFALVFVLSLLQAQWTYTGYDASAHIAEETVMARLNSAWGVFLSVAVSAVAGYILLLILTWCIPNGDVATTATDSYPVLYIAYQNLNRFFANLIAVIIGGAMWLCGCASIISMGRMWYAFARDGGMPFSRVISRVSPGRRTPVAAILITCCLAILLCVYAAAYYVITSISTITLYLAYVIPIYLNWRNKARGSGEFVTAQMAPWNLGKYGHALNTVAIIWSLFIAVIFSVPPNELVLWTMLGFAALLWLYWMGYARRHFQGPRLVGAEASST